MENTDNQEDIIEDIVESDLLSLEQGEVEESVSENVEEIEEGKKKVAAEASELKKAKAEGAHEDEEDVAAGDDSPSEEDEDEDAEAVTEAAHGGEDHDEEEKSEGAHEEEPEMVNAGKHAEGEDDADSYLKARREKRKGEKGAAAKQDLVTGKAVKEETEETEEVVEATEEVEETAEVVEEVEEVIASEDLTRLVEDEEGLTPEFKAKAALIFEAEVRTKVEETKTQLESEYEAKLNEEVETINETLTNQVDAYLTYAVEEWINENEVAIETSLRTSIAENFMNSLKTLFVENYVEVPESKVNLFDSLEEETAQLREELEKANNIADSLADRVDDLSREKILAEATKDLAETQAAKLLKLAEGVDYDEDFTKNVETLKKFYFSGDSETITEESQETEDEPVETIVEGADVEEKSEEPVLDKTMAAYMETLGRLEKSAT